MILLRLAAVLGRLLAALALLLVALWGALALWFRLPGPEAARGVAAGAFALLGLAAFVGALRGRWRVPVGFAIAFAALLLWWDSITPPLSGDWAADVARQTTGKVEGDTLTLSDVRDFAWTSDTEFKERWRRQSFDLNKLKSLDLFLSYWAGPQMAHLIMSFGFEGGDHLAWSVEVRREKTGVYSPVADAFKSHTLVYLATAERDVVRLRADVRKEDVRLYRLTTSPEKARAILLQYVDEANALVETPAWYNSIATNCTTAVVKLIRAAGGSVPFDWRLIANGYLPGFLYDRRAVDTSIPLAELIERARIRPIAPDPEDTEDYSKRIREGVPPP
jgi:hypothetical protein